MQRTRVLPILPVLLALTLGGCAATTTAVAKRQLDVQSRMSDSIFLDPVAPAERTVYVEVKNTSDKADLDLATPIRQRIAERGFVIVEDPRDAHFLFQVNVLQAGRSSETATEATYKGGFGGTLVGGAVGGGVGYAIGRAGGGNDVLLAAGGALLGAAIESVAGALVQDVTYTIVSDLQVSERVPAGEIVTRTESASLAQGSAGTRALSSTGTTDLRAHRTRVVSTANKVNLDWPEAAPSLIDGLTRSIAGVL